MANTVSEVCYWFCLLHPKSLPYLPHVHYETVSHFATARGALQPQDLHPHAAGSQYGAQPLGQRLGAPLHEWGEAGDTNLQQLVATPNMKQLFHLLNRTCKETLSDQWQGGGLSIFLARHYGHCHLVF